MKPSVELLEELKEQHDKRSVSVLVGAGFSKNAISSYPDWDGLLRDLVQDLYSNNIEERYRQYRSEFGPYYYTKDAFEEKEIARIIREEGYLNLVSRYIEKKGYREAIDVYIEDHLPYVEETNGVFKVTNKPTLLFNASNLNVHKELLLCKWKHVYTTNYDNLLELANNIHGMDYRKITVDYKLTELSEHRGIVKVHGDLVGNSLSKDYEFDNDKSRRYIISAEDYATYAEKHQAFSYQMKTGLLTGVFCLIGFSGNDPNFLGWLEWMKDVLDRDAEDTKKDKTKVYLLTIGKQKIDIARQLFYQNHHIGLIDITDVGVLDKIGAPPQTKDVGAIFTFLFRYLNDGTAYVVNPIGNTIVNSLSQYQRVWSGIDAKNVTAEDVKEVRRLRNSIIMPPSAGHQRMALATLYNKKEWTKEDAELFSLACLDCGLWFFDFRTEEKNRLIEDVSEWRQVKQVSKALRMESIDGDEWGGSDWKINLQAMQSGYALDPQKKHEAALKWMPSANWIINKAASLAYSVPEQSRKLIDDYLKVSTDVEGRYYASVLGNVLSLQIPEKYSYNEFKIAGIPGFYECRDVMLKNIKYEKKEVKPYGSGGGWSFQLTNRETDVEEALRFMELLILTGFPLQWGGYSLISPQDWYEVFKRVYGYMPYPALYYSLQLTDKNTLLRIGQDYAFAEPFAGIVPDMLTKLLRVVANEAKGINWESSLWVAKEMLCSVSEEVWYDELVELFNKVLVPKVATISTLSSLYHFMQDAAYYLKNPGKKLAFLDLLLEHYDKNTYYFSNIRYKIHLDEGVALTFAQLNRVKDILGKYPLNKSFLIAAHLGHCGLLDEEAKQQLREKIKANHEEVEHTSFEVLYSLTFITYGDEDAMNVVKKSILVKDVWHCGIDTNSATVPQYLSLNKISRDVKWTDEDLKIIMENLEKNLALLEGWKGNDDGFFAKEHVGLLADMMEFMEHNVLLEGRHKEYETVLQRIKAGMIKLYGSSQLLDKIFDKDVYVNEELQLLARCIDFYGLDKYRVYVDAVIDRALLQCKKSLTMMLAFVEYLVEKHIDKLKEEKTVFRLKLLLQRYEDVDYQKLDLTLPVAYRCLYKVAEVLKKEGLCDDRRINYWLEDEFVKKFKE